MTEAVTVIPTTFLYSGIALLFVSGLLIGMLVALKITEETPREKVEMLVEIMSICAKQYQGETIERGYGEMYEKEIAPEKHPGLTVSSYRWIDPEGFEPKEEKE